MRFLFAVPICLFTALASAAEPVLFHFDQVTVESRYRPQNSWKANPSRVLSAADIATNPPDALDEYGGSLDYPAEAASGFFQSKKIDGRWWLIDPAGRRFIHAGVVAVTPGGSATTRQALSRQFGSLENWAKASSDLLHEYGFNGAGAWSNAPVLAQPQYRVPQVRIVNFMSDYGKQRGGTYQKPGHTGYPNDAIFVFDPEFVAFADRYAQKLASEAANPWLIGWFSDNEMPLYEKTLDKFLQLPATDPGFLAAKAWLVKRQGGFATALGVISADDRQAFTAHVYETYLRIVSAAIRKYDPNHLYFGSRLHSDELRNPALWRVAGQYVDVMSVNYYRSWAPDAALLKNWETWSNRPVMITEWYTKGHDTGMPNTTGAGAIVKTQADRGRFYQNFTLALLESGSVVGWHWFKYQDNDPEDLSTDPSNRDANKGIVDIRYQPYLPLLQQARDINIRKYRLTRFFGTPAE